MEFTQIKETCLYVKDLDDCKAFYHDLLGFPVIGKVEGRHIFFRVGTSVLLCFISEESKKGGDLPGHYGGGKIHIAFEAPRGKYEQLKQEIKEKNISILHEEIWKWSAKKKSFYFEDPDGHLLEVIENGLWEADS
ncbi:VOC family protein [Sediminitomix flava]|uniref:Glyoxalase/bleomycin resistance protein/dioxygenase superfamily protein n=1 Tax=Sediminitomix flava TaxID=379075 RepID=A0A315Z6R7_SEDFL|nr:VOC family protein [Sediminitomix flava]PWJ39334.1 glyoxalase/bleomycin resistance protein/dioxygenase superfamily protein [Sediminitomix flava]